MQTHSPRAFPLGVAAPVGTPHVKVQHRRLARERRPRPRTCLRKGCHRKYVPRRWNQRYCQDPECQRQVRRWQAARRQAKHREEAVASGRHAQAEKERRQRAKAVPKIVDGTEVAFARVTQPKLFSLPLCDRPECHEAPASSPPATRHATALAPAVRPFAMCRTENANGSLAVPWMAVTNGP
jgi:hypothetical protein